MSEPVTLRFILCVRCGGHFLVALYRGQLPTGRVCPTCRGVVIVTPALHRAL
jgi:hypothetical protein